MVSVIFLCGRSSKNHVRGGPDATLETSTKPQGNHLRRGPCVMSPLLIARLTGERVASCADHGKLRTSSCLALPKLTEVVEPLEGDFSILADIDEVDVGISHVAEPFTDVFVYLISEEVIYLVTPLILVQN